MSNKNKKFSFKKTFLLISFLIGTIGAFFWTNEKYFVEKEVPKIERDSEAEPQLLNLKLTTEFQRIVEKVKNEPVPEIKKSEPEKPKSEERENENEELKAFRQLQSDKENQARLAESQRWKRIKAKQQVRQQLAREKELTRWQNWVLSQLSEVDQQRQITIWQDGIINEVQTYWNNLAENDLIDNQTLAEILPNCWKEKVQQQTSRVELDKLEQQAKSLIYRAWCEWEKKKKGNDFKFLAFSKDNDPLGLLTFDRRLDNFAKLFDKDNDRENV
jgi:hypothetical protein